jgi:hypothetical protein
MGFAERGKRNTIIGRDKRQFFAPGYVKLNEEAVTEAKEYDRTGQSSMREQARRWDVGYGTIWQATHGVTPADVS